MTTTIGYAAVQLIPSLDGFTAAVDKQLGGTLAVAGKQGGKKWSAGVADGMKAGEADVKRALDGYSKLYDKAADQSGKLKVAEAALQDLREKGITSGARYERAIAAQEKAQRDHNRALRDAKDAFADFERAQQDAASGSSAAGSDAGGGFLDGFSTGIAALGTKAGPIGVGLTAAAGVALAVGGLIGQQVMAGMEREVASDRIAAQLGLSESEAARFGASSGRVYADNFGESLGDVNSAMADVASTLGKDAPTAVIEDMTAKALTFRDVFGTEVSESIATAQNLIVNGLAPDAETAFDAMVTAYQRVPAAMRDELPDVVNEYATFTDSLGFSLDEVFGLIVKNAPRGQIAIDKVGDALKEFTLLATDIGAKPVQDALAGMGLAGADVANNLLAGGDQAARQFDQVIDGLLRIPDAGQQAAAAIALFGTPLEDLDKAKIPEFLRGLDNAEQQMQGFTGAASAMVATAGDNAAGTVESAKRAIEGAMGGMQDTLATAFEPVVTDIAEGIITHQGDITNFFLTTANAGAEFGASIGLVVGGVIGAFGQMVSVVGDGVGVMLDGFEGMIGGAATVADALGMDGFAGDLRGAQDDLGTLSDSFHSAGDGIGAVAAGIIEGSEALHDFDAKANGTAASAQNAQAQINNVAQAMAALPGGKNIDVTAIVTFKDATGLVISPDQLRSPSFTPAVAGETRRPVGGGRKDGGSITGPGGPKSDIIPIWASNGEHVWTAEEVEAVGGHGQVEGLRAAALAGAFGRFADGGAVGPDVAAAEALAGTPYSQGNRTDCSGMAARVIARALGLPETGLMTTKNAEEWLSAAGFQPGIGGPGQISVGWYDRGPNPNDGHMAMTLSDGTNAEAGGKNGVFTLGANAAGADSPQFDKRMFLPTMFGEGQAGSFSGFGASSGSGGGGSIGIGPNGESGTYTAPDGKAVREADQKVADADQRVRQAELKIKELDADAKESQRQAAQAELDKAKREASDARADRDEVMKGTFTPGSTTGGAQGGGTPLGFKLPSSFSGLASMGLDGMGFSSQVSPSSPVRTFEFGDALGAAVGGQVSSVLDVFGTGNSPGWLNAASTLLSGISIGGGGGMAPLSLEPVGAAVAPPDNAGNTHGTRAGQAPGPTYNIQARDTEDAFVKAQRVERERVAARLSRY